MEGLLIKIPKKGDLGLCSNYRGITLLSVPRKVMNRVILERLKGPVDRTLGISKLASGQASYVLYRSDHNTANYSGTINWMEPPPPSLCKFCGIRKGSWQPRQGVIMEAAWTLWCTHEVCQPDSKFIWGFVLQNGSRGEIDREVWGKDRSKAGMPSVTFSVYLGYRLDHESCHKPEKKWDPVDLVDTVSWTTWTLRTI